MLNSITSYESSNRLTSGCWSVACRADGSATQTAFPLPNLVKYLTIKIVIDFESKVKKVRDSRDESDDKNDRVTVVYLLAVYVSAVNVNTYLCQ